MRLSDEQVTVLIYFLMYCVALGVIATLAAGLDSLIKFIIRRKLNRIKCLDSKH